MKLALACLLALTAAALAQAPVWEGGAPPSAQITGLAFSSDSRCLLCIDSRGGVRQWELPGGRPQHFRLPCVYTFERRTVHQHLALEQMAISPDSSQLAFSREGLAVLCDRQGKVLGQTALPSSLPVAFSGDGRSLICGDAVLSLPGLARVKNLPLGDNSPDTIGLMTREGSSLSGDASTLLTLTGSQARVFSLKDGYLVRQGSDWPAPNGAATRPPSLFSLNSDGQHAYGLQAYGSLWQAVDWDVSHNLVRAHNLADRVPSGLDGEQVVVGPKTLALVFQNPAQHPQHLVCLFSLPDWEPLGQVNAGHLCALSPDGAWLASLCPGPPAAAIKLWSLGSGEPSVVAAIPPGPEPPPYPSPEASPPPPQSLLGRWQCRILPGSVLRPEDRRYTPWNIILVKDGSYYRGDNEGAEYEGSWSVQGARLELISKREPKLVLIYDDGRLNPAEDPEGEGWYLER